MEYTIDCTKKKLGRVASDIAVILQGKRDPNYNPRLAGSDKAIIKNVDKLELSGKKEDQKIYYSHSGRVGHLKERQFEDVVAQHGRGYILRMAVLRMLPKNRLRSVRIKNLIIE